jgi:hypothetical protein
MSVLGTGATCCGKSEGCAVKCGPPQMEICVECGNDDAPEGFAMCVDCMEVEAMLEAEEEMAAEPIDEEDDK